MTITERVYRVVLRVYPEHYRWQYGEPMTQLLRDRIGAGADTWVELVRVWTWLVLDTIRAAPEMRFRELGGGEGGTMRVRSALAGVCSLSLGWWAHQAVSRWCWRSPAVREFLGTLRPAGWFQGLLYEIIRESLADMLTVLVVVAIFLLLIGRLNAERLRLCAVASLPVVTLGVTALQFLFVQQQPAALVSVAWFLPILFGGAAGVLVAILRERGQVRPKPTEGHPAR